jgi:hypothetical protein
VVIGGCVFLNSLMDSNIEDILWLSKIKIGIHFLNSSCKNGMKRRPGIRSSYGAIKKY